MEIISVLFFYWSLFNIALWILCSRADSPRSCCMWFWMSDCRHFEYPRRCGVLTVLSGCYMAGATWNCSRLGADSVYTIQPCTSLQFHFIRNHICSVHVCLAVICHLHFWQNYLDPLRATAVTEPSVHVLAVSRFLEWECCSRTLFCFLAILDRAFSSFLAGVLRHKKAGIGLDVSHSLVLAVWSLLLDPSKTRTIPVCIPLCLSRLLEVGCGNFLWHWSMFDLLYFLSGLHLWEV